MGMYRTITKLALMRELDAAKVVEKETPSQTKLGASDVGLRHYLDSRRLKQKEPSGQEEQLATDMYPKVGALVAPPVNAATAPMAPRPSDVKVPKPSVASVPGLGGAERRPPAGAIGGAGSASGAATGAAKGQSKTAMDPTLMALLAGGLGGTGGYFLGKHVISPFAEGRISSLQEAINNAQRNMGHWQNVSKYAPAGAAAAGAILLAALAASKARKDEREKMERGGAGGGGQQYYPYDPSGAGFYPEQQQHGFGNFYG